MLEPQDRTLLFEALRPPPGYALDEAVGTTFSLDLLALLHAPLAFTLFQSEDAEGNLKANLLALLQSLRTFASRITLFCQAGQIAAPKGRQPLFPFLEDSVVQVRAPHPEGVFHPKVWVLRFTRDGEPVRYRLLVLSRNLTFDRSWDTVLSLEGEVKERKNDIRANRPLGDFLKALPSMALREPPAEVRERIERMQQEVRGVHFEIPEWADEYLFWALGLNRKPVRPFFDSRQPMLVVSPFLSPGLLREFAEGRPGSKLVSRLEALQELDPETRALFEHCYVLAQEADPEEDETTDAWEAGTSLAKAPKTGEVEATLSKAPETDEAEALLPEAPSPAPIALSGLHAKFYVQDDGWNAAVWTGSANATEAAFERNVEFLVELRGKKRLCGINALLGHEDGVTGLADLLQEFVPGNEPPEVDAIARALEERVEAARRALAGAGLLARAVAREGAPEFDVHLEGPEGTTADLKGVTVLCRPITLREVAARPCPSGGASRATFVGLSRQALTAFFAFRVTAEEGGKIAAAEFVLRLPLEGAPLDRMDLLLRDILKDRSQVERFLLMLLAAEDDEISEAVEALAGPHGPGADGGGGGEGLPLLEALLRTLHRDPRKLEAVDRFVEDLSRTEEGRRLLPDGLDRVWPSIRDAGKEPRP